ncbi:hypothetical protein B9Z55_026488 [Caenorhabditis nigoni]|uniref:Uncharacterized protein n=1 Tax=Caenorhabditis nigoni TaxID=1611254 RepID=A0A2G5T3E4_9PELO|nr:hypothetical protein B9Z55_026488 [Caenorhabditis nigoni]
MRDCYPPHQTVRTATSDLDSSDAFWGNKRFIEGEQKVEMNIDFKERRDGKKFGSIIIYVTNGYRPIKRAKMDTKDIRQLSFMTPKENEKMGIMKIFVTRSGMSEMWRVLPDSCRAEAEILKSQGIKEHKVPFFFAFKLNDFKFSEFKSPIKNWIEFGSIWSNFENWYCAALETAGLLGKRIVGPIADPFDMEMEN